MSSDPIRVEFGSFRKLLLGRGRFRREDCERESVLDWRGRVEFNNIVTIVGVSYLNLSTFEATWVAKCVLTTDTGLAGCEWAEGDRNLPDRFGM